MIAERGVIDTRDVARFLGRSPRTARRLLDRLEADGLKRKPGAVRTYLEVDFRQSYAALDAGP